MLTRSLQHVSRWSPDIICEAQLLDYMAAVLGAAETCRCEVQKDCTGPPSWEFEVSGRLIERAESEGTAAAPIVPAPLPGSTAALGRAAEQLGAALL